MLRSQDILGAVEAGVEDGMDVLNMSLGGTATPYRRERPAAQSASTTQWSAGVVVAIAVGQQRTRGSHC